MAFPALFRSSQAFYGKLSPALCRSSRWLLAVLISSAIPLGLARPALGERPLGLQFCAVDDEPRDADIFIAIAYHQRDEILGVPYEDWVSQGWYRLPKESSLSCVTILNQALEQRYYYFYAYTGQPTTGRSHPRSWDGPHQFCMVPRRTYSLGTAKLNCSEKGAISQGFREIDTLGAEGYRVVIE